MKRSNAIWLVGLAVTIAVALGSCNLGTSVEARLDAFLQDLNSSDRSNIYLNFHPKETADYAALKAGSVVTWGTLYPTSDQPYSYADLNMSSTDWVTGRIVGTTIDDSVVFVMAKDGTDWQIVKFSDDGGTTFLIE